MTPLEENSADGASGRPTKAYAEVDVVQLVRNTIESAKSFGELDEAIMLKNTHASRGDIKPAELTQMKLLETKIKERLKEVA